MEFVQLLKDLEDIRAMGSVGLHYISGQNELVDNASDVGRVRQGDIPNTDLPHSQFVTNCGLIQWQTFIMLDQKNALLKIVQTF